MVFICRFYLCIWYKDDPNAQQKFFYYLSRLRSKAILRDSSTISTFLTRDTVKKITLALGQDNSFSRGFDKILQVLLVCKLLPLIPYQIKYLSLWFKIFQASLRENSPVIRAKAMRAVSLKNIFIIVKQAF